MGKVRIIVFVVRLLNARVVANIRLIHFAILKLVEFVGAATGAAVVVVAVDNVVVLVDICCEYSLHDDHMNRGGDDECSDVFLVILQGQTL